MLTGKRILLVISGGIAAYKSLELIRLFKKNGAQVRCILTHGGAQFVTPLSVAAISEEHVYTDLWSLKDETEMGHIRLSREADLILVAPASANIIAQMTHGLAEDLASTTLLATSRPVLIAPAMNPMMWQNSATQDNIKTLKARGIQILEPAHGDMACGETGTGRLREPQEILDATIHHFNDNKPLAGKHAIVTAGPTYEPIDPVRFIGNRSSGKQGYALAKALISAGANVTLISGPTNLPPPDGSKVMNVETAQEMLDACEQSIPADIAVCAAAVCDWSIDEQYTHKYKKGADKQPPNLTLKETPDILRTLATHTTRPDLVIGFAAETQDLTENAKRKLDTKKCDWIIANEVGADKAFGTDDNKVHVFSGLHEHTYGPYNKDMIARDIVEEIIHYFETTQKLKAAE